MNYYKLSQERYPTKIIKEENKRSKMNCQEYFLDQIVKEFILLKKNFWLIILSAFISLILHYLCVILVFHNHIPSEPLYDLGYTLLPTLPEYLLNLHDYILCLQFLYVMILLMSNLCYNRAISDSQEVKSIFVVNIITRTGLTISLAIILRCIAFLSTSLPAPTVNCLESYQNYDPPKRLSDLLIISKLMKSCGDLIFSGHTLTCVMISLAIGHYWKEFIIRFIPWLITFAMVIALIAGRQHYTVDVIISLYLSPLIFYYCLKYEDSEYPLDKNE